MDMDRTLSTATSLSGIQYRKLGNCRSGGYGKVEQDMDGADRGRGGVTDRKQAESEVYSVHRSVVHGECHTANGAHATLAQPFLEAGLVEPIRDTCFA